MDMHDFREQKAQLRLATNNGRLTAIPAVPAVDRPETTLVVSFRGLTEAEQRAALAAFPGGKRFRLSSV